MELPRRGAELASSWEIVSLRGDLLIPFLVTARWASMPRAAIEGCTATPVEDQPRGSYRLKRRRVRYPSGSSP
jgi:hypothetical protein